MRGGSDALEQDSRARVASLLTWAGALLLVVAGGIEVFTPPRIPPDFGTVPSAAAPAYSRAAMSASVGAPATSAAPRRLRPRQPTVKTAAVPMGKLAPLSLALQGREAAEVVPIGVTRGSLDIPAAVNVLGWWVGGSGLEAADGSIVITGHVDSRTQGNGYMAALRDVTAGQRVTVTGADGSHTVFVVTGRRAYRKAQGLPDSVFDGQVQRRLVLITCTGAFDANAGRYEDNLVVYAVPATAAIPAASATEGSAASAASG